MYSRTLIIAIISIVFLQKNTAQDKQKPNVILIMCDDFNDYQGAFGGHPQAKTPNIDKLAASGVRFHNAQTNVPVCQPSRNSFLTGVYPHRSKDYGWTPMRKQPVLQNNKTIMMLFKENGYITLGTGKIGHTKPNRELDWDDWGANHSHNYGPFYFDGKNTVAHPSVPEPYKSIGSVDGSYGRLSSAPISKGIKGEEGWVYGGWSKKPFKYINDNDRDLFQDELHAKWATKKIKAMETAPPNKPFFMGVGFVRPHTPLHAPDKYFDMYPIDELELSDWIDNDEKDTFRLENFGNEGKGAKYYRMILESYDGNRELALKHFLQAYLACVTFVDEQVGKVISALENSIFKDNTIIIFTSDHGWQMGEKSFLFKNSPWEESARIPLIIKGPDFETDLAVEQPVSLVDIYPTLIDICKLQGDNKLNVNGANLGGYSLKPLLEGSKKWNGPNGALTLVGVFGNEIPTEKQNFSYRTKDWRYIKYGQGQEELYNHKNDPFEWHNLADQKKFRKIKEKHSSEMYHIINNR